MFLVPSAFIFIKSGMNAKSTNLNVGSEYQLEAVIEAGQVVLVSKVRKREPPHGVFYAQVG